MACNCLKDMTEKLTARVNESLGNSVAKMDECDFANRVLFFGGGKHFPLVLKFNVRYYRKKKNGEAEKRLTNADTNIMINYCPWCGTKVSGDEKEEAANVEG